MKLAEVLIFLIETDFYQNFRNLIFLRLEFGCKMSIRTLTNGQKNEIRLQDPHFLDDRWKNIIYLENDYSCFCKLK